MYKGHLTAAFVNAFPGFDDSQTGEQAPRFFYSPGRVNLIGEHIDYNGGFVFPCAPTLGTYAVVRQCDDGVVRLASGNFDPAVTVDLSKLHHDPAHGWANNAKGVAKLLQDMGHKLGGFDMYIWGDLPSAAGLSSSASLCVLVAMALDTVFGLGINPIDRALLCQRVENEYLGVNCGIMDQFACTMGKKNHAILLKCDTLEYSHAPLNMGDFRIVLANTNKPRALADSKYNERRAECDKALAAIQTMCNVTNLCELTPDDFMKHAAAIPDKTIFNRALHVVNENTRVKNAVKVLNQGDLASFGEAMTASHVSLRDLYEVTGKELDALAQAAWYLGNPTNMLGSRMTGAGFGGCTVSIVHKGLVDEFIAKVGKQYNEATGLTADFYVAETDDGARELWRY